MGYQVGIAGQQGVSMNTLRGVEIEYVPRMGGDDSMSGVYDPGGGEDQLDTRRRSTAGLTTN